MNVDAGAPSPIELAQDLRRGKGISAGVRRQPPRFTLTPLNTALTRNSQKKEKLMQTRTCTYAVEFKVIDERKIYVEVPEGTSRSYAFGLFCNAAAAHLDFKDRHFTVTKCDREYNGSGGIFQTYLMPNDNSGHIYAEVWFDAYAT
jgi:hypothetical protein